VRTEITGFLDAWVTTGYARASTAYLVPEDQVTPPAVGPVLASGRIRALRPGQWTSQDLFVVDVDLDLSFTGDPVAWGNGVNTRFITAAARSGAIPYVLELATSP
jgi:hypothetical protein